MTVMQRGYHWGASPTPSPSSLGGSSDATLTGPGIHFNVVCGAVLTEGVLVLVPRVYPGLTL